MDSELAFSALDAGQVGLSALVSADAVPAAGLRARECGGLRSHISGRSLNGKWCLANSAQSPSVWMWFVQELGKLRLFCSRATRSISSSFLFRTLFSGLDSKVCNTEWTSAVMKTLRTSLFMSAFIFQMFPHFFFQLINTFLHHHLPLWCDFVPV